MSDGHFRITSEKHIQFLVIHLANLINMNKFIVIRVQINNSFLENRKLTESENRYTLVTLSLFF